MKGVRAETNGPSECKGRVCAYCSGVSLTGMKKCGRCKLVHYCDRECQKEHWKQEHKRYCTPCLGDGKAGSVLFDPKGHRVILINDNGSRTVLHCEGSERYAQMMEDRDWDWGRPENAGKKKP